MRVILWLAVSAALFAQKETINLAASASDDRHPQLLELLKIKRLYVERLNGGETSIQFRDMLIGALQATRLFVLTENAERADTILKGAAEDLVFTDVFTSNEAMHSRTQIGGTRTTGTLRGASGVSIGENESVRTSERKHEAMSSVRLVNKDGDVIWSTTQESFGGKFRSASADVAAKIVKQLVDDFARAKKI